MTRPHGATPFDRQSESLRIVEDALELPASDRDAFLDTASQGDAALRRATQDLLRACDLVERNGAFLSEAAGDFAEPILRDVERRDRLLQETSLPAVVAALKGRYEFVRELGRGGSAVVHLARDLRHGRSVAIKVIRQSVADEVQRSRFLHEISIAAQLRHPYVVPLLDSGEADGALFSVMPYIEGESLRQRLDREGPLSLDNAFAITREVAEALDYAHARGIVHRDIKPQNILLGGGHALVADFGIALAIETTLGERLTEQGIAVGTPTYMSPEQATASAHIDARSDVYSLGCVVYEMLAGEAPYTGVTPRAVIAKHVNAPVPDLGVLRPGTTGNVRRALEIALAKSPADRYATAGAFCAALTSVVEPQPEQHHVTPSQRWWIVAAAVVLAAVLGTVAMQRATGRASAPSGTVTDTTRYAFFPILRVDGDTSALRDVSTKVHDALKSWSGLELIDPSLVSGFPGLRRGVPWNVEAASAYARATQAGRFVWGEASRSGDSLRVHLRLSDVSSRGLVLTDRVVHTTLEESATDTMLARAVDQLLVRPVPGFRGPMVITTRSLPAQQMYVEAWRALLAWKLDSAGRLLEGAIANDPQFGQAHLWLALVRAWSGDGAARYTVAAEQASLYSAAMTVRERDLTRVVVLESRGELGQACPIWARLTRADSSDFVVWYGAARCHRRDDVVHRDRRSPSRWSFRSSYHQAIHEYQTAFRLQPSILTGLQDRSFEPLRRLLFAGGAANREGYLEGADSMTFYARMAWVGDSLAFVPHPEVSTLSLPLNEGEVLAVRRQREAMRSIALTWVATHPQSAPARHALAVALAMLGDATAPDALAEALHLAATQADSTRIELAQVWMLVSFGVAGPDLATLRRAALLANTLLDSARVATAPEPMQMAALAALVGRTTLATRFMRRGEIGRLMDVPTPLLDLAPALLTFAVLGGPMDSVSWLADRVEQEIKNSLPQGERASARQRWLVRAATLCFPLCSVRAYAALRDDDYLLSAQLFFTSGDTARADSVLRSIRVARRGVLPEDLTVDDIAAEARLLYEMGNPRGAAEWLIPIMDRATRIPPHRIAEPVGTASLVRAMVLRGRAAAGLGESRAAKRWSDAVAALRSRADSFPP